MSGQIRAPAALSLGKSPRYPLVKRWVGPRADLDAVAKKKCLFSREI